MDFKLPYTCGVIGKPQMGKTYLINWLMSYHSNNKSNDIYDKLHYGLIFSHTKFNKSYNWLDNKFVYDHFNEKALQNLMKIQSDIRQKYNKMPPPCFLILDDAVNDFNNKTLINAFFNYRHYNLTIICASQYPQIINSRIRSSLKYAFIFKQFTKRSIEAVYESYGELGFDKFIDFKNYILEKTGDFKFIFVNNNANSSIFEEQFKIMKCPPRYAQPKIKKNCDIKIDDLKQD